MTTTAKKIQTWTEIADARRAVVETQRAWMQNADEKITRASQEIKNQLTEAGLTFTTHTVAGKLDPQGNIIAPFAIVMAKPPNVSDADVADRKLAFLIRYGRWANGAHDSVKPEGIHGCTITHSTAHQMIREGKPDVSSRPWLNEGVEGILTGGRFGQTEWQMALEWLAAALAQRGAL